MEQDVIADVLDLLREYLKASSRPPSLGEAKTDAPQIWGDGGQNLIHAGSLLNVRFFGFKAETLEAKPSSHLIEQTRWLGCNID